MVEVRVPIARGLLRPALVALGFDGRAAWWKAAPLPVPTLDQIAREWVLRLDAAQAAVVVAVLNGLQIGGVND